jgi:NAD(P)-dependent dehydrogenase (short-subunit alcohol dehydrogenase family)
MSKAVLITGATGRQGGAVVNALLPSSDFTILAVTRNTASPLAQKLVQKSPKIKLVQGDLNDPITIFKNAKEATDKPIWGVFSVQVRFSNSQLSIKRITKYSLQGPNGQWADHPNRGKAGQRPH